MVVQKHIYHFREAEWFEKYDVVVGVDEVGRGALAGPLCASAVAVSSDQYAVWLESGIHIGDSKKLTLLARARARNWISDAAILYDTAWVSARDIDEHGITWANVSAMQHALDGCLSQLPTHMRILVITDNVPLSTTCPLESFPRAESASFAVAVASIVAKESRDEYMKTLEDHYPGYGWESHVGYGTLRHREAIKQLGVTPKHRKTFLTRLT